MDLYEECLITILYVPVIQNATAEAAKESNSHLRMKRVRFPKGSDINRIRRTAKKDATKDIIISTAKTIAGLR